MSHTPLTRAAVENNLVKFQELIGKGANVNERDTFGWAPIHLAMQHQDGKIARFIMTLPKFDINIQRENGKETPLMFAITFQRRKLAQELLAKEGINTFLYDANGHDIRDYLKEQSLTVDWLFSSAKKQGGISASTSSSSSTSVAFLSTSSENPPVKEKVRESKKNDLVPLKDKVSKLPEATRFTSSTGEIAKYYFKNNPWKFSEDNNFQKVFRYCIICGNNRFSDAVWSRQFSTYEVTKKAVPTICDNRQCYNDLSVVPAFVPRKHYMVETPEDRRKAKIWPEQQPDSYEDIRTVTTHLQFDKVFKSESDIPSKFFETFSQLEKIPVQHRIMEIDNIYFDYAGKNEIEVGSAMSDTTDLFLRALDDYRNKSCEILESMRKGRAESSL
jgi:hypothetical protein